MSPPQQLRQETSNCSSLLIYRPRKDERLSWPSWLGWLTHISGHPSARSGAQDSESTSAKDQCSTAGPRNQPGPPWGSFLPVRPHKVSYYYIRLYSVGQCRTLTRSEVVRARTNGSTDDATGYVRMSVVESRQLLYLRLLRMVVVIMMVMRLISVVAARTTPTVAVGVATVRRTVFLVYQVFDERHDRLRFIRHRLQTHRCAIISVFSFECTARETYLWPPYVIGQAIIFLPCGFFLLSIFLSFFLV